VREQYDPESLNHVGDAGRDGFVGEEATLRERSRSWNRMGAA
jgi:hypothetical protein